MVGRSAWKAGLQRMLARLLGYMGAFLLLSCRLTTRLRIIDDPRPALRLAQRPYVYALLHAHQLAAVFVNDEAALAAMVSRSADGDLLVPLLQARGVMAVRGSSRSSRCDTGGGAALATLAGYVGAGQPALLAVDGPRGPRNRVHRGVVTLARQAGASILPVVVVSSRRWILGRTWDRFQIPKPFAHICLVFGQPIDPEDLPDEPAVRTQLTEALLSLETQYDSQEAKIFHATHSAPA